MTDWFASLARVHQYRLRAERQRVRGSVMCLMALVVFGLSATTAGAQSRWPYEQTAGAVHCHATFDMTSYQPLFNELAALERDLGETLGVVRVREPVHIYLFSTQGMYQQYVKQYFPDVPYRRALFVKTRGPGMVFAYMNPDFAVDLRHESTHAVLHASLPMVPLWLDEGLAEYFEVPRKQRARGNPHMGTVRWGARFGRAPNLEDLETRESLEQMGRADYRNSWAWTHFMLHGPPEAREVLVAFLADIRNSTPPGQLSRRLRRRIPDLEDKFVEHFRSWQ